MASLSRVTDYQMTLLESFSHLALKKEIQAQQDLKVRTRNQKELQHAQFTENYFRCLDKVSSLDVFLSELANHAAANTTEMIDNAKEKTVDFSENLSQNLVQCWEWVTQTIHLAEIHVGHALDYQKFHFNADDLLTTLSKSSYLYYRYHSPSSPIPPSLEVQHLIPQLQEHINHLAHCKEQTDFLCNQAKDLVPVNLRVERLNSPQPGIWLCRYTNNSENISLEPHEQITVLDNSTASVWNIKTMKGQVIDVPAIGCLITGPELAANGKERNLREMIYRVYRAAYKAFSPEILRLMKGIAENFLANKLIIEDNHQKDFLTTLTEYNEILSSASTELNRDPSWLKAYDSCKDYIINKKSPRQVIAYGKQQFAGADLINQLRVMIRLLKDLRKLVVVLRRKLRPSDVSSEKSLTKEEMINSTLSLNNFTGSQLSLAPDQRQSKLYTQIKPYKNDSYNRWINVGPQMKKSVHLEIDASPKFRTRKVVTLKTSFKQMAVKKLEVSKVAINMNKRMVEDHSSFKKTFKDREGQSTGIFVEKKSSKTQLTQTDNQKKMQDFPTQTEGQVLLDDFSSYSKPKSMLSCGAQTTPVDQSCQSVQTNDQKKMQDLLTQTEGQVLLDDFSSYSKPKSMLTRGAQTTPIDQSSQFAQTDEKKETRAIQTNFSPTTQFGDISKELEEEIKENLNDLVSSGRRRNPDKICQTQTPTFISLGCQVAQTMTTEKGVDSIKSVYHEKGNQCDTKGQLINMKASQCVSETELTAQIRFKDCELQGLDVLKIENKLTSS